MNVNWFLNVLAAVIIAVNTSVNAKRTTLRILSPRELKNILKTIDFDELPPQGRLVPESIALVKGFALGLTKGIGGAVLYDVVTSNTTTEAIQTAITNLNLSGYNLDALNLNALNLNNYDLSSLNKSTLISFFSGGNGATTYSNEEICFPSLQLKTVAKRSARSNKNIKKIDYENYNDEDGDDDDGNTENGNDDDGDDDDVAINDGDVVEARQSLPELNQGSLNGAGVNNGPSQVAGNVEPVNEEIESIGPTYPDLEPLDTDYSSSSDEYPSGYSSEVDTPGTTQPTNANSNSLCIVIRKPVSRRKRHIKM